METFSQYNEIAAVFVARVFLGLLFFFQGYDAVYKVKIKNVIQTYESTFMIKGIPKWLTTIASWFTSCSALIGGLFLIFGLFEYITLYVLALNLIIASIGFGINTPMWDMRFVFPRLLLVLFLLLVPQSWNVWSIDYLLLIK